MDTSVLLREFHRKFLCCTKVEKMNIELLEECIKNNPYLINKILSLSVNDELVLKYPLRISYQMAFLKYLEKIPETKECDEFYEALCEMMVKKQSDISYTHHLIGETRHRLIIRESSNLVSDGTTGLHGWEASIALSEWIIQNQPKVDNKIILELGSGTGLVGLTAYKICSPKVFHLSDCHPLVLQNLCANVRNNLDIETVDSNVPKNQISCDSETSGNFSSKDKSSLEDRKLLEYCDGTKRIEILDLAWEDINNDICRQLGHIDLVIGADLIYDSTSFECLVAGLNNLLQWCEVQEIVLACTVRNMDTLKLFFDMLEENSFTVCDLPEPLKNVNFVWNTESQVRMLSLKRK